MRQLIGWLELLSNSSCFQEHMRNKIISKNKMSVMRRILSQTCQSLFRACPTPNLYDLPTATCNLEPPSSLSPRPPPTPFSPTANNKDPDEVTVGGNVRHQMGCVIFWICDANHLGGFPCNPSRYWFLQDKELKSAPLRLFRQVESKLMF